MFESIFSYPFERVRIDIVGPLESTRHGNKYILVVCDYYTKFCEAYVIPNQEIQTIAGKLCDEFFSRYGILSVIHTDRGANFESKLFQAFLDYFGVMKTRTTAYYPQSNGLVERFN